MDKPVLTSAVRLFSETIAEKGFFLLLHDPVAVPPHLALLAYGHYYSLSVKGLKKGSRFTTLYRHILQKQSPLLAIELDEAGYKTTALNLMLEKCFGRYENLNHEGLTCLAPIRDTLSELYASNYNDCGFVFELYPKLAQQKRIKSVYHLHLDSQLDMDKRFTLRTYTSADIQACINRLLHADR